MIDMHSHILPNIDDGSKSMEETLNLIEEAKNAGFNGIVLTPHYIEGYYEADANKREGIINDIRAKVQGINLYTGNEVYISENIIKLLEKSKISTINNTKYILFEMPMNVKPMNLYEVVYELLKQKKVPILAHPERYSFICKEPELVCDLIKKGVLMQGNYGSLIGQYGRRAEILLKKFLTNNMVHFLGTDVHRQNTIYTKMPEIKQKLEKILDEDKIKEISEINPKTVLEDGEIKRIEIGNFKYTFIEKCIMK